MTVRVAFISPDRRQGTTTVSALASVAMGMTQNLSTCLTFTGSSTSMSTYLGLQPFEDKTRNMSQLVKLLEANAINGEEVGEYCSRIEGVHNFQILDASSDDLTREDNSKLVQFVTEHIEQDVVMTDVTTEIYDQVTKDIVEQSDLIVLVLTQARDIWKKMQHWETEPWDQDVEGGPTVMEKLSEKGVMFVFNQYDPNVEAFRDTTKKFGIRHRRCCKIHYNSWIKRTSNQGKLHTILPYIIDKDPRVVSLNKDMEELLTVMCANLGLRFKWKESL